MGRSGGCCITGNCTAPPCPEGTCCYLNEDIPQPNGIGVIDIINRYTCEENTTENCCISRPSSLFNKGETSCGQLELCPDQYSKVIPSVFNTDKAFILLKHDGSVVTWGDSYSGGQIYKALEEYIKDNVARGNAIKDIYTNSFAVVAVDLYNNAYFWGGDLLDYTPVIFDPNLTYADVRTTFCWDDPTGPNGQRCGVVQYFQNIKSVIGSEKAFAAIKTDGTVVAFGDPDYGGFIPSRLEGLLVNIVEIASTDRYFAAKNEDGEIFIWGNGRTAYDKFDVNRDGSITSSDALFVANRVNGVYHSAADVNRNGEVTAIDSLLVQNQIGKVPLYDSGFTDVKKIYSNKHAFAFLKNDGSVFVWGDENKGGNTGSDQQYLINIKEIYNTDQAFLAHREDNKIVIWGDIDTSAGPNSDFYDEVIEVAASKYAFGLTYIVQGVQGSYITLKTYADVIGSVVPNKENKAQRFRYIDQTGYQEGLRTLSSTKIEGALDFFNSYSGPYDPKNPPINIDGDEYIIGTEDKRLLYASQYAFHVNFFGTIISIGNSPDDEHNSHDLNSFDTKPGNIISTNNLYLHSRIASTSFTNSIIYSNLYKGTQIRNGSTYASTARATAYITNWLNFPMTESYLLEDGRTPNQSQLNYVVSFGHDNYGGFGGTSYSKQRISFNQWDYIPPVIKKGYFEALFSNDHAFCAIRFKSGPPQIVGEDWSDGVPANESGDQIFYEIITWGNPNFGGDSSTVNFEDVFVNTKAITKYNPDATDLIYTHGGCHQDFCNQGFT